MQEQYALGDITAKDLVLALTDVPEPPQPLTKEQRAEHARKQFPDTVKVVAERLITGIETVRLLARDIRIVFENQGIDMALYAPLIASMATALEAEVIEAERLMENEYGTYF